MRLLSLSMLVFALAGCVGPPSRPPATTPAARPAPARVTTPPMAPQRPQVAPSSREFIAPRVQDAPGLRGVIGANATALANLFGPPRLTVREGDAIKLQFSGSACVLDAFLYPLQPGGEPSATHVEARRSSDGQNVDRAACVRALRR